MDCPKFFKYSLLSLERVQEPFRILEKRERGHIQGLPKLFKYTPYFAITGKATNFKFCTHFHTIDYNNRPVTSVYRAHRAVIFEIARLSSSFLYLVLILPHCVVTFYIIVSACLLTNKRTH